MDRNNQTIQHGGGGRPVSGLEAANANEYFDQFLNATSLKHILGYYRGLIDYLHLKPAVITSFYPKLRANLTSWRAKALWKKFDARASHKCYQKGKLAAGTRVLIIGGGPCGMRAAIEAQLLGAKVVVVEKRDRFSRNNVLHLWPFVIEDLRMLGAKKFFGKFCAGAIDHISIRQLQCILMKVALLLGVEVHTEVSFEKLIEPSATQKTGWRAEFKPANHPVSLYEFDVIIGADGKRNTLQGFSRKEFRGKLAIAITANFINKKTEAEARVEEISGVAFIFNQKFFKDLLAETRIDLENIVYYKDDTHYFVMTAKKASLIEKGVIKQDLADTERLLAPENVDREALQQYAIEAANFSTNYQMPNLEFAVNHYGQPDIAMFDFTSMYAAENASKVLERNGHRLLMILVGDSLLEPFWPTGSGCARGFLSSLDAAWAIRCWSMSSYSPLEVIAERESIYRLLAQTTPDNLNKGWKSYTVDPSTRYPNLNKSVVMPHQVVCLYDTDNPNSIDRMKRISDEKPTDVPKKKKRRGNIDNELLLNWLTQQLKWEESIVISDINSVFRSGKVLCAIIHHYRPDLLDYSAIKNDEPTKNNQIAIDLLEKELGIPPLMTGADITNTDDYLTMASYLAEIYDAFRGEIPHIRLPKLDLPESVKISEVSFKTIKTSSVQPQTGGQLSRPSSRQHKRHAEVLSQKTCNVDRKTRKRRTLERVGASVEDRQKMLEEISSNRADRQNRRRYQRKLQTEQFLKSMQMLQANAKPDSQPFEDYSIFLYRQTAPKFEDRVKDLEKQFTYIPDHDNKTSGQTFRGGGKDEDLAARIKSLENKWRDPVPVDKKPKDLLRAIGKIETSDWNIKEIEKKIQENKMGKPSKAFDREKVPKWSKEQFLARQTKMEKQHLDRQDSVEAKYADIDKSIKNLDQKLKEGTVRELGTNKVATITEKLTSKVPPDPKPVEKSVPRPLPVLPTQGSEMCHFCGKRVYLMERLSAEGRFFHHGCFKCQFCYTQLRLGSYAFDRDGQYGYKFFCLQHFGMVSIAPTVKVTRKPSQRVLSEQKRSPEKKLPSGISGVDLLDKVHTPERIEFSNLSVDHISSDQEDSLSQMDEDEWTDKNFGASCAELDDSDDDSSSMSDTDSDDEDAFDDALEEPVTKEGTMKWAERWKNSYSRKKRNSDSNEFSSSDQSSYYENTSDVIRKLLLFKRFMKLKLRSSRRKDESDTATEGEEEIRARELRKKEVCVEPPIVHTDTGTDTEIVSDETSSESSSEIHNSATEISTDSEFAQDDPTPTREIPSIVLNDFHVTKTRGSGGAPKRIQVTTGFLQRPSNGKSRKPNIELKLKPLVPTTPITTTVKKPAPVLLSRTEGYALNRTQSTGGIAAKVSLELKKKYLLGEQAAGSIQKSGSASTLDTKFKSFHTNISDCQKLLKPATEISASMQTFCNILNERKSPVLSPQSSAVKLPEAPKEEVPPVEAKSAEDTEEFVNVSLGRPRSPVHETSIIVPQIDWSKSHQSLSSDSLASSDDEATKPVPRVEIHTVNDEEPNDDFVPDSLCIDSKTTSVEKSISSEKKALNQPKPLPNLENLLPEIHNSLHIKYKKKDEAIELPKPDTKSLSGVSSPESGTEQATAALTETELSDWARDELASDEFEYAYFEPGVQESGKITKDKDVNELKNKTIITEAMNNILSGNLDNIEFMDTGTETSSDDGVVDSQNGYVLFKNDYEFTEDSLSPNVNDIVEAVNIDADKVLDNSQALKNIKPKDHEEDSLVVVETGTTTEENTCSDSTVRNVTEIGADQRMIQDNKEIIKLSSADTIPEKNKENLDANNIEFEEHCQRLQSRIEFGNVKDSIDVRKSRRKSKPDLIQEDVGLQLAIPKGVTLNLTPTHTPDILYNKEILKKERDTNQRVVQEMVMNRMKAENKSLERKRRKNPLSPFDLTKSATTDLVSQINSNNLNKSVTSGSSNYNTPDVLLSTNYPLQNSKTVNVVGYKVETPVDKKEPEKQVSNPEPDTPKAPPRQHRSSSDTLKITDKSKQTVKLRDKEIENLNSAEPELSVITPVKRNSWLYSNTPIKKNIFRRSQSGSYETNHSPRAPVGEDVTNLSARTKSIPDFPQKIILVEQDGCENERDKIFKSDPNILESTGGKSKKKSKDRERRKSITKLITTLFTKKSPSSGSSKGLFSKLSPTKKEVSKDSVAIEPIRKKSFSEGFINRNLVTPPPVPPLPLNYVVRKTDESSDGEHDRKHDHSSCDTLDNTGMFEQSTSSLTGRRSSRSAKRASRQVQHKRHRMAQEIQRKLEETEVKTKVLEQRGVMVEKALRGEDSGSCSKDECDLLQEWFDLMRDRTELRRYERELTVRAQELELEDRHARLQHELRERIELDKEKTEEDVKTEESIINEMINIVEKRDSLIAEIEEDRIRYSNEDRDLEEQMLAKGLRLTPIKKSHEK
ncbi:molecule interacting with CasL isoform X2 [Leptinotarsa decemlineata]|uniref:molecule interacting with CasL isoform X2 n=1 Tax=Leptinotarsa decemlineata TaxID=7539 RepID=UPI003D30CF82